MMKVPDSTNGLPVREVPIVPALSGFYFDFIMRCHITQWKAPGGHHCGGWCRCKVKQEVEVNGKVGSDPGLIVLRDTCKGSSAQAHDSRQFTVRLFTLLLSSERGNSNPHARLWSQCLFWILHDEA